MGFVFMAKNKNGSKIRESVLIHSSIYLNLYHFDYEIQRINDIILKH